MCSGLKIWLEITNTPELIVADIWATLILSGLTGSLLSETDIILTLPVGDTSHITRKAPVDAYAREYLIVMF